MPKAYQPRVVPFEADHVYLFTYPPCHGGASKMSFTPFGKKVEAYLRLTGIPFTVKFGTTVGRYGKLPFIELNGEQHADSSAIVEVLTEKFGHDLNKRLSAEQRAVGHSFQRMVEESLYWHIVYSRWQDEAGFASAVPAYFGQIGFVMHKYVDYLMRPTLVKELHGQGTGRLPPDVVLDRCGKDLAAISTYLGDKPFFLGTAGPTYADVCIFAMLDWLYNSGVTTMLDAKAADFTNLPAFVQRMNGLLYPSGKHAPST
eukprot:TRINITY_DN1561_c0_g1_i2.p2 TRINITY_DN1561_c0_g1~~TRINITY_DN1561_c0_g1_i2.p2  ORF type:complete len:258 (-),score=62.18 TRINITY_DN1561_c0_g1_i2:262-1035(-)